MSAEAAEGRKKLAGYKLRAPMLVEKMIYDAHRHSNLPLDDASRVEAEFPVMSGAA